MANEITNEELATMIKGGFDAVDRRFDKVEKDVTELKQGQTDIKARLENLVYRFEFSALERRVEELEIKLKGTS